MTRGGPEGWCVCGEDRAPRQRSAMARRVAPSVRAGGVVLNQLSWNWRECWQPAGSHASHWVARVGQARRCEASAWMSRMHRPSSWSKLSTIVERPGQPVALIPRKRGISCVRASVLPSLKNRDTFADTSRATLSCTGGQRIWTGNRSRSEPSLETH